MTFSETLEIIYGEILTVKKWVKYSNKLDFANVYLLVFIYI